MDEINRRRGRSKPNVAGERYDSNANPIESKPVKVPVAKPVVEERKTIKKKKKKVYKARGKKDEDHVPLQGLDDFLASMISVPVMYLILGGLSMYAFKLLYRSLFVETKRMIKRMPAVEVIGENLLWVLEELLGPVKKFKITFNHVLFMTFIFALISVWSSLQDGKKLDVHAARLRKKERKKNSQK